MNFKKFAVLSGFIILITVTTLIVFAEEPVTAPIDPAAVPVEQQAAPKSENDIQWAWGEVTNLDAQAKTLTLKYLDYETDQEKDLVLTVDEKTVFENIKSLDEIKINDTLSIDYTVGTDGKNIAKNINFEKPDSSPVAPAQAVENAKPADMTPVTVVAPQPAVQSAEAAAEPSAPANAAVPAEAAPASVQAQ